MTNLKEQARAFCDLDIEPTSGLHDEIIATMAAFTEKQVAEKDKEIERLREVLETLRDCKNPNGGCKPCRDLAYKTLKEQK